MCTREQRYKQLYTRENAEDDEDVSIEIGTPPCSENEEDNVAVNDAKLLKAIQKYCMEHKNSNYFHLFFQTYLDECNFPYSEQDAKTKLGDILSKEYPKSSLYKTFFDPKVYSLCTVVRAREKEKEKGSDT